MNERIIVIIDQCTEIANTLQRLTSADAGSATVAAALLLQVDGDRQARDVAAEAMGESKATFMAALESLGLDGVAKHVDIPDEPDDAEALPVCETTSEALELAAKKGVRLKVMVNGRPLVALPGADVLYEPENADPNDFTCNGGRTVSDSGEVSEKTPAILPFAPKPLAEGQIEQPETQPDDSEPATDCGPAPLGLSGAAGGSNG